MCEIKYCPVGFAKSNASPTGLFVLPLPSRFSGGHFLLPKNFFANDAEFYVLPVQISECYFKFFRKTPYNLPSPSSYIMKGFF